MKSQIDWNEIVPRLDVGLQQTLYLEAVKLITSGRNKLRDYQREYYRQRAKKGNSYRLKRRIWSAKQKAKIVAYAKEHGRVEAGDKFKANPSMIGRWVTEAAKPT